MACAMNDLKRSLAARLRSSSRRRQRQNATATPAAAAMSNSQPISFTRKV